MTDPDPVRLLMDEMYAPAIADDLRQRGFDVVAVCGHDDLGGVSDERVLDWATAQGRCVVTENVRDFERLRVAWVDRRRAVAGLVYVSSRTFPRTPGARKRIVDALARMIDAQQTPSNGGVIWLA